jgi:phage shock protein C
VEPEGGATPDGLVPDQVVSRFASGPNHDGLGRRGERMKKLVGRRESGCRGGGPMKRDVVHVREKRGRERPPINCRRCTRAIDTDAAFCAYCGATQRESFGAPFAGTRLERSVADRQIAGVCGGLGVYLGLDAALVRLLWIVLTIVPGAILFGLVVCLAAWLIIPEATLDGPAATRRPLARSNTDMKLAGVCGGLAGDAYRRVSGCTARPTVGPGRRIRLRGGSASVLFWRLASTTTHAVYQVAKLIVVAGVSILGEFRDHIGW